MVGIMSFLDTCWERAKGSGKKVVLPEGDDTRVLEAAYMISRADIAHPIILGDETEVAKALKENGWADFDHTVINPLTDANGGKYATAYYEKRKHKGLMLEDAAKAMKDPLYYGTMMLESDDVDLCVVGAKYSTGSVLKAAFTAIGASKGTKTVSSTFLMELDNPNFGHNGVMFFADCAVNPTPSAEELADIAIATADTAKRLLGVEPCVAMLSFSTKGSTVLDVTTKIVDATNIVREKRPDINIDGELQADAALIPAISAKKAPGSTVAGKANCLIFPSLEAGNISYKLVEKLAGGNAVGPIIQGLNKPLNDLSRGTTAEDIANLISIQVL